VNTRLINLAAAGSCRRYGPRDRLHPHIDRSGCPARVHVFISAATDLPSDSQRRVFVRNRTTRAGSATSPCSRPAGGNFSCDAAGSKNSPPFWPNQGRPSISTARLDGGISAAQVGIPASIGVASQELEVRRAIMRCTYSTLDRTAVESFESQIRSTTELSSAINIDSWRQRGRPLR